MQAVCCGVGAAGLEEKRSRVPGSDVLWESRVEHPNPVPDPDPMPFSTPVEPLIVTSPFGPRPRRGGQLHPGLDLACGLGQVVHAVAPGVVKRSYFSANFKLDPAAGPEATPVVYDWHPGLPVPDVKGYGETVVVALTEGLQVRYAHLSERLVREGDHVEAGQPVGRAGSTGFSFGVHLHFEVLREGQAVDPLPFFARFNPVVIGGAP